MSLNKEFIQLLSVEIKNHNKDSSLLYKYLVDFKNRGMDKESMLKNLEELKKQSDSEKEDVFFDLMDYVVGFCNPSLSIF